MITPGGRIGDASPLGKGPRRLSTYERQVAHALMRRGIPKERAIPMARGIINRAAKTGRWGRGKKASPNVIAGAQASIVQRKAFSAGHKLSNEHRYTHGWKLIDADHETIASEMTTTRQAQAALSHHSNIADGAPKGSEKRDNHNAVARIYKARRDEIVAAKKRRGEQGTLFANADATISSMTSSRELLLAEAASRGMIDLGRDGAKWRHNWVPLNGIAAAIKAKKYHGGKSAPSGKSRINVGAQAEHALAPKGKARATAVQRARGEVARRAEVMRMGKESDAEAVAQGSRAHTPARGAAAAKALQAEHNRRSLPTEPLAARHVASLEQGDLRKRSARLNHVTPDGFAVKHSPEFDDHGKHTGGYSVSIEDTSKPEGSADRHIAGGRYTKGTDNAATEAEIGALGRARDKRRGNKQIDDRYTMKPRSTREAEDAASGKVTLKGNESYNITTGKRVETSDDSRMTTTKAGVSKIQANNLRAGDVVEPGGHLDKYVPGGERKTVKHTEKVGRETHTHFTDGTKMRTMPHTRVKVHPTSAVTTDVSRAKLEQEARNGGFGDLSKRTDGSLQRLFHGSRGAGKQALANELRRRGYKLDADQGKWTKG